MRYISKPSKPEEVEAIEVTWGKWDELDAFFGKHKWMIYGSEIFQTIQFKSGDKDITAHAGNWLVKYSGGYVMVMKDDDFREHFKPLKTKGTQ